MTSRTGNLSTQVIKPAGKTGFLLNLDAGMKVDKFNGVKSLFHAWTDDLFCRVACLWFITGRVASVKARIECDTAGGFLNLPLPSSKLLWEASTSPIWESEYELDALDKTSRVATVGELIDAHQRPNDFSNARLDTWNTGIDDLGFLLNLATAMV